MKAIYINLDPYLAAFAAWLKGGKVGTKPDFQPLPLAVTIPLGEDVAVYCPGGNPSGEPASFVIGDYCFTAIATGDWDPSSGENIASNVAPGLSKYDGIEDYPQVYSVKAVSGSEISITINIRETETEHFDVFIPFTVLVRRETASGPVDLVDFTPPAAAPSASDIKSALVAAGSGALAGVNLGEAIIIATGADGATLVSPTEEVNPSALPRLNWQGSNEITLGSSAS